MAGKNKNINVFKKLKTKNNKEKIKPFIVRINLNLFYISK